MIFNVATWNVLASLIDSGKVFIPKCVKTLCSFLLTWRLCRGKIQWVTPSHLQKAPSWEQLKCDARACERFIFTEQHVLRTPVCHRSWWIYLQLPLSRRGFTLPPSSWFHSNTWCQNGEKAICQNKQKGKNISEGAGCLYSSQPITIQPSSQAEELMGELTICVAKVKCSDCLSPAVQCVLTKISAALHLVISVFGMKWFAHTASPQISPIVVWQEFPPCCTAVDWQCVVI